MRHTPHIDPPEPLVLLGEATLEQILVEIASRFDYALIGAVSDSGTAQEKLRVLYSGGKFPAIGLAHSIAAEVQASILAGEELQNQEDTP